MNDDCCVSVDDQIRWSFYTSLQGYTDTLTGRCLGERWRMVVRIAQPDDHCNLDFCFHHPETREIYNSARLLVRSRAIGPKIKGKFIFPGSATPCIWRRRGWRCDPRSPLFTDLKFEQNFSGHCPKRGGGRALPECI